MSSTAEAPEAKKQKKMADEGEKIQKIPGKTVARYLTANVKEVLLPEKFSDSETYPTLVLDGASGVGKTQQFFSLVKSGKAVVYLLMVRGGENPQPVYDELSDGLGAQHFGVMEDAMQKLKAYASALPNPPEDLFSVGTIKDAIKETPSLNEMIFLLYRGQVEFHNDELCLKHMNSPGIGVAKSDLDGKVLFVDEALPKTKTGAESSDAHVKLRFIRNLGRALKMRVVLAGTAATAATMHTIYSDANASRGGSPGNGWVECEFVWIPMTEEDLDKLFTTTDGGIPMTEEDLDNLFTTTDGDQVMSEAFAVEPKGVVDETMAGGCESESEGDPEAQPPLVKHWNVIRDQLQKERPLLAVYCKEVITGNFNPGSEGLPSLLRSVGTKLALNKGATFQEGQLIWLSGAWLRGQHVAPSPVPMEAPDLVKSHFFEPAIATRKSKDGLKPYHGYGFADVDLVSSPLRLSITKNPLAPSQSVPKSESVMWSIAASRDPSKAIGPVCSQNATICHKFGGVSYALKHVVQQCLATEPIMAVTLSTISVNPKRYEDLTPKSWKETKVQHTSNQVCGEVNEHISFTALQVCAQGNSFPSTTTVEEFCQKFSDLAKPPDSWQANVQNTIKELWGTDEGAVELNTQLTLSFFHPQPLTLEDRHKFLKSIDFDGTPDDYIPKVKGLKKGETKEEYQARKDVRKKFEDELKAAWKEYQNDTVSTQEQYSKIKMPWLVPACTTNELKEKINGSPHLFNGMNIAGLVPGEDKQSPFDASAFLWKENAPREWLFEFKIRQKHYVAADGVRDLEQKIKSEEKKAKKNKGDRKPMHAMLIAIRGEGEPEMHAWMVGRHLRVVLLVRDLLLEP